METPYNITLGIAKGCISTPYPVADFFGIDANLTTDEKIEFLRYRISELKTCKEIFYKEPAGELTNTYLDRANCKIKAMDEKIYELNTSKLKKIDDPQTVIDNLFVPVINEDLSIPTEARNHPAFFSSYKGKKPKEIEELCNTALKIAYKNYPNQSFYLIRPSSDDYQLTIVYINEQGKIGKLKLGKLNGWYGYDIKGEKTTQVETLEAHLKTIIQLKNSKPLNTKLFDFAIPAEALNHPAFLKGYSPSTLAKEAEKKYPNQSFYFIRPNTEILKYPHLITLAHIDAKQLGTTSEFNILYDKDLKVWYHKENNYFRSLDSLINDLKGEIPHLKDSIPLDFMVRTSLGMSTQ